MNGWRSVLEQTLWVGLGGFLGANARYWLAGWVESRWGNAFPWGTFVINVTGSFVLGLFMALISEKLSLPRTPALRLIVAVGFVGAYTTFSTFEYETLALLGIHGWVRAAAYAVGSLVAGFVAVALGSWLGRTIG